MTPVAVVQTQPDGNQAPTGIIHRRTFKYRLYPTRAQALALGHQLSEACRLYNAALEERRDAWKVGVRIGFYDQSNQLKDIRAAGDTGLVNYTTGTDVLQRVDRAFKAFFRRAKGGEKSGYPRFRSRRRYDSYTFTHYGKGCGLSGRHLRVQGVGLVKIKLHRPVGGEIKTVSLKREGGHWYACFSVVCGPKPLPETRTATGIDVGLYSFAVLSDGEDIPNPRHYRNGQAALRVAQRRVARRKKGGTGRKKAVLLLRRAHIHIRNQRADFHHKLSRQIVNKYGFIALEDLQIRNMTRKEGHRGKSIKDAGWGLFAQKLVYKAAEAGRELVFVNPYGTSQRCVCGAPVPKTEDHRWHRCPTCGLSVSRDHASAMEILRLGRSLAGLTWPVEASVPAEAVGVS